jgi:hypothetical protein
VVSAPFTKGKKKPRKTCRWSGGGKKPGGVQASTTPVRRQRRRLPKGGASQITGGPRRRCAAAEDSVSIAMAATALGSVDMGFLDLVSAWWDSFWFGDVRWKGKMVIWKICRTKHLTEETEQVPPF